MNITIAIGAGRRLYYMYTCMLFGQRSGPKLFDNFAKDLKYIKYMKGVMYVCHFLDDSLTMSGDKNTCEMNLSIMLNTCKVLG